MRLCAIALKGFLSNIYLNLTCGIIQAWNVACGNWFPYSSDLIPQSMTYDSLRDPLTSGYYPIGHSGLGQLLRVRPVFVFWLF